MPPRSPHSQRQNATDNDTTKQQVRRYLENGVRSVRSDSEREPARKSDPWHRGYLEASERLARDLCRHLDVPFEP